MGLKVLIFSSLEQSVSDSGYRIINDGDQIPSTFVVVARNRAEKIERYFNSFESKYYSLIDAVNNIRIKLT